MIRIRFAHVAMVVMASVVPVGVAQQPGWNPAEMIAAQQKAMDRLSFMDGIWKGPAWILTPSGEKHTFVQTERIGPFLDGAVKVIEGRGYEEDGSVNFNAFGIIYFDPIKKAYSIRSYTQGRSGDYNFELTADGFTWEIPAGPAIIRYTAKFKDGTWHQIGERIMGGDTSVQFFEMTLERTGDTDWPAAGAVRPD